MEYTLYDSDLKSDELDKLIAEKPELEILRHLGEFEVECEGNLRKEDNRFDAPYQEGWVTGGSIDDVVEDLEVTFYLDENMLETLEELKQEESISEELYLRVKQTISTEPRNVLSYDITAALTPKAQEELENKYIEKNAE